MIKLLVTLWCKFRGTHMELKAADQSRRLYLCCLNCKWESKGWTL